MYGYIYGLKVWWIYKHKKITMSNYTDEEISARRNSEYELFTNQYIRELDELRKVYIDLILRLLDRDMKSIIKPLPFLSNLKSYEYRHLERYVTTGIITEWMNQYLVSDERLRVELETVRIFHNESGYFLEVIIK